MGRSLLKNSGLSFDAAVMTFLGFSSNVWDTLFEVKFEGIKFLNIERRNQIYAGRGE